MTRPAAGYRDFREVWPVLMYLFQTLEIPSKALNPYHCPWSRQALGVARSCPWHEANTPFPTHLFLSPLYKQNTVALSLFNSLQLVEYNSGERSCMSPAHRSHWYGEDPLLDTSAIKFVVFRWWLNLPWTTVFLYINTYVLDVQAAVQEIWVSFFSLF